MYKQFIDDSSIAKGTFIETLYVKYKEITQRNHNVSNDKYEKNQGTKTCIYSLTLFSSVYILSMN